MDQEEYDSVVLWARMVLNVFGRREIARLKAKQIQERDKRLQENGKQEKEKETEKDTSTDNLKLNKLQLDNSHTNGESSNQAPTNGKEVNSNATPDEKEPETPKESEENEATEEEKINMVFSLVANRPRMPKYRIKQYTTVAKFVERVSLNTNTRKK